MAEEQGEIGAGEAQAGGADEAPAVGILSQYVKDLSFENPNSPAVFQWQTQPVMNVEFNIGSQKIGDDLYEVGVKIDVTATADNQVAFQVELLYAGLFALRNIPEAQMEPFLLAEAPRLLFPYARQIIDQAVQDGGFPPMRLEPIDFGALYMQRLAQQQGALGGEMSGQA
jgi:preprotein translocase subunit SecB